MGVLFIGSFFSKNKIKTQAKYSVFSMFLRQYPQNLFKSQRTLVHFITMVANIERVVPQAIMLNRQAKLPLEFFRELPKALKSVVPNFLAFPSASERRVDDSA